MKLLLDTHAFLWWILDNPKLSRRAREAISDGSHELFLSVASGWEMAIKAGLGRLSLPTDFERFLEEQLALNAVSPLPVLMKHAVRIYRLPKYHADPFDHLLIAQAQVEGLTLITSDRQMTRYDVKTLW